MASSHGELQLQIESGRFAGHYRGSVTCRTMTWDEPRELVVEGALRPVQGDAPVLSFMVRRSFRDGQASANQLAAVANLDDGQHEDLEGDADTDLQLGEVQGRGFRPVTLELDGQLGGARTVGSSTCDEAIDQSTTSSPGDQ